MLEHVHILVPVSGREDLNLHLTLLRKI